MRPNKNKQLQLKIETILLRAIQPDILPFFHSHRIYANASARLVWVVQYDWCTVYVHHIYRYCERYTWHNCLWNERTRKSYRPLDSRIYPFSARWWWWRKSYVYFFRSTFSWKRCTHARGEIGKYICENNGSYLFMCV